MAVAPLVASWSRQYPGSAFAAAAAGSSAGTAGLALTATYDPTLARVRLVGSGLPYNVTRVEVRRYDTAVLTNPVAVRGGTRDAVSADTIRVEDYEFTDGVENTYELRAYAGDTLVGTARAVVTPALGAVWLINVARPYLNRIVTVHQYSDITRPARGGVLDVLGRRDPVAITDVRGSRRFDLTLKADTTEEVEALDLALSFGDPVFLQVPAGSPVPGPMHAFVGDVTISKGGEHQYELRFLTLPLTEVDAPAAGIVGATVTNAGILSAFATCADVLAFFATCLDLLQYVSNPVDEVVG